MPWVTLCKIDELREGEGHFVDVEGWELAVFLHRGRPYVTDNTCPHAGGSMGSGYVEVRGETACAVCPWHGWAFRLDSGEYHDMPGFELRVFPARVHEHEGRRFVQADLPMP